MQLLNATKPRHGCGYLCMLNSLHTYHVKNIRSMLGSIVSTETEIDDMFFSWAQSFS